MSSQYLLYLVLFVFALIVIINEDRGDDDDQDGGLMQPAYSQNINQ